MNPTSLAQTAPQSGTVVDTGKIGEADYRIDIPIHWNRQLVIYCHGYSLTPVHFDPKATSDAQWLLDQGYAIAQSGFSGGGWVVHEALKDTENLRRYFTKKFGKPTSVYALGPSLGGFLVTALIESYPDNYSGGLALCAPLGSADWFLGRRVFDFRVVFDYYFPGKFPSPASVPGNYVPAPGLAQDIATLVRQNPKSAEALARFAAVQTPDELAELALFFTSILGDLEARASGNPFDNTGVVYEGLDDADALNSGVHRYVADPAAAAYLRNNYTASGLLKRPVLAVRNAYDPIIPAWVTNAYLETLAHKGSSAMFSSQLVTRPGHCAITQEETRAAFEEVVNWVSHGTLPGNRVLSASDVKRP